MDSLINLPAILSAVKQHMNAQWHAWQGVKRRWQNGCLWHVGMFTHAQTRTRTNTHTHTYTHTRQCANTVMTLLWSCIIASSSACSGCSSLDALWRGSRRVVQSAMTSSPNAPQRSHGEGPYTVLASLTTWPVHLRSMLASQVMSRSVAGEYALVNIVVDRYI